MMKRLFAVVLLLLMLCGCGAAPQIEPAEETTPTAAETLPALYDNTHSVEELTSGAVRGYSLEAGCEKLLPMGNDLLLVCSCEDGTQLLRVSGAEGAVTAYAQLEHTIDPTKALLSATDQGVTYYDPTEKVLILLNSQLRPLTRIHVPEGVESDPVLSEAGDKLYYCTGTDIREYDIRSGQSRLLLTHSAARMSLLRCAFDDDLLLCSAEERTGEQRVVFLSTENGKTLEKDAGYIAMDTCGQQYFYQRREGVVTEALFGTRESEPQALYATQQIVFSALRMNSAVTALYQDGVGTQLQLIDLDTGCAVSEVTLAGISGVKQIFADETAVWLLGTDADGENLFRWDPKESPVHSDTSLMGQRHTAQDPDEAGIQACQAEADRIGQQAGVDILIWTDALAETGGYSMEAAFHTEALEQGLASLNRTLERYPADFFQILGGGTGEDTLHICLVRHIDGSASGVQYWANGDAYIALEIGANIQREFDRELSHVLDTFIIARSRAYDSWEKMNPSDFSYDLSYSLYENRTGIDYLTGDDRAFIESFSMTYPREDRATVLEYAMQTDQADCFASDIMQKKLETVCKGIRQAFGWEESEESFLWEQYLHQD